MIKPIGAMVLIKPEEEAEKTTKSGIVIASTVTKYGPKSGVIVDIGDGEQNYKGETIPINTMDIGDIVFYMDGSGTEVEDNDGTKYILVNNKHILAIKE